MDIIRRFFTFSVDTETEEYSDTETEEYSDTETEEHSDKQEIEIPASTYHEGNIYLYYTADTRDAFDSIEFIDKDLEQIVNKPKNMTRAAVEFIVEGKKGKQKRSLEFCERLLSILDRFIDHLDNIEQLRIEDSGISFGDPSEYHNNLDLDLSIVQRRNPKLSSTLYRSLYIIEWTVKVDIINNWEKDEYDISDITSNASKQAMYTLAMQQYGIQLAKAVEFREKYFSFMEKHTVSHNVIEMEFIKDIRDMINETMKYTQLYMEFTTKLSRKQRKKLQRKNLGGSAAEFTFNWETKHVNCHRY